MVVQSCTIVGRQLCDASAHVAQRASQAYAVAESLGVSVWDEVVEVADQIADMTGMKVLERRRFLAQLQ